MSSVDLPRIREYGASDEDAVVKLWAEVFPGAPQDAFGPDIRRKLAVQPDLFLVAYRGARLVGTVIAGFDGHRGWIYRLAVALDERRRGVGRALVGAAEQRLERLGCPKVNLQVRAETPDAVGFYRKLGYRVEKRISMGRRLIRD